LRRSSPRPPRRERRRLRDRRLTGSSGSSLHAKTFAVDGERIFVGSFNFDPRSTQLNTEIGFLLDSPAFAQGLALWFTEETPHRAYRVKLDARGALRWIEGVGDLEVVHNREPGASRWRRSAVKLLALLPIDWLL
jgi:putative cardiolipin synthase